MFPAVADLEVAIVGEGVGFCVAVYIAEDLVRNGVGSREGDLGFGFPFGSQERREFVLVSEGSQGGGEREEEGGDCGGECLNKGLAEQTREKGERQVEIEGKKTDGEPSGDSPPQGTTGCSCVRGRVF